MRERAIADEGYWLRIHEAGHIVTAQSLGIAPRYAVVNCGSSGPYSCTCLPTDRKTDADDEALISVAGFAAEMLVHQENENPTAREEFTRCSLLRAAHDVVYFLSHPVQSALEVLLPTGTGTEKFVAYAALHAIPRLRQGLSVHLRGIERALKKHGFLDAETLARLWTQQEEKRPRYDCSRRCSCPR